MKLTWKLTLAYAWRHPARMLLTSLAMIASACVVVWVVGSYDAMAGKFGDTASEYLGRYDLFVVPDATKEQESYISPDLIAWLRKDAAIAECEPVLQASVKSAVGKWSAGLRRARTAGSKRPRRQTRRTGQPKRRRGRRKRWSAGGTTRLWPRTRHDDVRPVAGSCRHQCRKTAVYAGRRRWIRHGDPTLREAVISNIAAESLQVKLDDDVLVIFGTKEYRLKSSASPRRPRRNRWPKSPRPHRPPGGP